MDIRLTKNRQAILDILRADCTTLSAAEIHTALPQMDLTTIYRTLELFVQEGIIKKLHIDDGEARFEYQHTPHHHAVCTECDRVLHVTLPDATIKRALAEEGFDAQSIDITIRGVCERDHS